jgi:hypothetical protein
MPDSAAQQFPRDLDKKLWGAADRLRASLDAAVYKHAVLGLIFLKNVCLTEHGAIMAANVPKVSRKGVRYGR